MKIPVRYHAPVTALLISAVLTACGGGSDGGGPVTTPVNPVTSLPSTPGAPSLTGNTALDGFNWINYRRQLTGVAALSRNTAIDLAAQGHTNYMRQNNVISHSQVSGKPAFTGGTLQDRLAQAKYDVVADYAIGEVISAAAEPSGFYHAEELIGAIYHRFVILDPVFRELGTGSSVGNGYTYFTADFAASNGYGIGLGRGNYVVYPTQGQTQVATNFFSDTESPDPVPNLNEVGYPISVHGDFTSTLIVQSFTVRPRGGSDLSVRLLTRATDAETPDRVAAIIPLTVLKANTIYDVTFIGSVSGVAANRTWSFTTK